MNASLAQAAPAIIPRAFALPTLAALLEDQILVAMKASAARTRLARAKGAPESLVPLRQIIFEALGSGPSTIAQLAAFAGTDTSSTQAALVALEKMGMVEIRGKVRDHRHRWVNLWAKVAA
jgi:predicted Rossmann fold nucleotide-binding protein DprA/Smf involved in DNA uptake